jgi:predicted ATP-dependent endonuclease of OLD family
VFFADAVVLVEGLSDRMVFEELFKRRAKKDAIRGVIEVVSVGGKGLFKAYQQLLEASEVQHFVIADLDYVEQVAPAPIRKLFEVNTSEISQEVLQRARSLDGDAIVRAVDHGIETGDWSDAREVWAYIKSRRRKLIADLSDDQRRSLDEFLEESAATDLFILSKGAIEAYLPDGFKGKRIERVIELISMEDFAARLPRDAEELHKIVETIIARVESKAKGTAATDVAKPSEEKAVA